MAFVITLLCALIVLSILWNTKRFNLRVIIGILYLLSLPAVFIYTYSEVKRVDANFLETRCLIEDKTLQTAGRFTPSHPVFQVQYSVDSTNYTTLAKINVTNHSEHARVLDRFLIHQVYPCWYNQKDPNEVYMEKDWYTGLNNIQAVIVSIIVVIILFILPAG